MHILPSTYCFLWSKWHRLFNGCRPPTFFSSTLEHVIMQLLRCLSLHITAQVLAKPSFQHSTDAIFPLGNINISMFTAIVHHICLHCSSLCFFVCFFFPFSVPFFSYALNNFSLVLSHLYPSILQSLILFLHCCLFPGWISCLLFLIFRALFWNGSGGSLQAGHFWTLLICALGGAFLLRLIRICLQGENQNSNKLDNE